MQITANRATVSTYFRKWSTLTIRNVDNGRTFDLNDRSDPSSSHSLFVASLPAGLYELGGVDNEAIGAMSIFSHADAKQRFPRFRIESAKFTDLGTLAYVRHHYPVNSTGFEWAQHSSEFERNAVLKQLEPSLAAKLSGAPAISWEEGDRLASLRAAYTSLRRLTMRMSSLYGQPDGTMLFGESFGQIAVRSSTGEWSWIETPITLPITAIFSAPDGALYAGSDDGILLVRRNASLPWEAVPLPVDDATIEYVGDQPGDGGLLVILQTRTNLMGISTSTATGAGHWKDQFSMPRQLFLNPALDSIGVVLQTDKGLVAALGGFETTITVAYENAAAGGWKSATLDERAPVTKWSAMSGGGIGQFRGAPITGMYFSYSGDGGATWEKRGGLNWAFGKPLFVSKKVGYELKKESIPLNDPEEYKLSLWRTDDTGYNWSKVGPIPSILGSLICLSGEDHLGYVSANGKFFSSSDGGKNWKIERELP